MISKVVSRKDYDGVSIEDVKNYLRIDEDNDSDDVALIRMIKSAIELVEKRCSIYLAEAILEIYFEDFDNDEGSVSLPFFPISEIVSCKIVDIAGVETDSTYTLKGCELKVPIITDGNIKIQYKAGYGIQGKTELAPELVKEAIISQVADWYENRSDYVPVLATKIKRLLKDITYSSWI